MTPSRDWIADLRDRDLSVQAHALADLRDCLRRTLAKGFGRQLADADLEDIAQEALLRVHRQLDTFAEQSRFTTWAAAIAVNHALSELRRRRYQHVSLDQAVERAAMSDDPGEDEADVTLLRQGIAEALTPATAMALRFQPALAGCSSRAKWASLRTGPFRQSRSGKSISLGRT